MANPNAFALNRAGQIQSLADELTGATIKVRLYTGTALGVTSVVANLTTNEVSGNGYPTGGYTTTLNTVAYDATDDRVEAALNAASILPSGGNIVFRQAVVTVNNGTEYIKGIFTWAADETANDGITYQLLVKLNTGAQGATVNIVDN